MGLLPLGKASSEHADLLRHGCLVLRRAIGLFTAIVLILCLACLAVLCSDRCSSMLGLTRPDILQRGAGASLLGKCTVENDSLGVLELAKQRGQLCVELVGRYPLGPLYVAANVI